MPIDPVCKKDISISEAVGSHDYHSETVYFCSLDCLHKFEHDPGYYMNHMSDEEQIAS